MQAQVSTNLGTDKIVNDIYTNSVIEYSKVKGADELVDKDLINLLKFVSRLPYPTDEEVKEK